MSYSCRSFRLISPVHDIIEYLSNNRGLHFVRQNHWILGVKAYLLPLITYRVRELLAANTLVLTRPLLILRSQPRRRSRRMMGRSTSSTVRSFDVLDAECLSGKQATECARVAFVLILR
jgi:hypothetical protein